MNRLFSLIITVFVSHIALAQSVDWDGVQGLSQSIEDGFTKELPDGWTNAYFFAEDRSLPVSDVEIEVVGVEIDPSTVSSDFITGFAYGQASDITTKSLEYAIKYEKRTGSLYVLTKGRVLLNLGRIIRSSTVSLKMDSGLKNLLVYFNGRKTKSIVHKMPSDAITVKGFLFDRGGYGPSATTELEKKVWISGDVSEFGNVSVRLNGSSVTVNQGIIEVAESDLLGNGQDRILISQNSSSEISPEIVISIDDRKLVQDVFLQVDGGYVSSLYSYLTLDRNMRDFVLRSELADEEFASNSQPFYLSFDYGISINPYDASFSSLHLIADRPSEISSSSLRIFKGEEEIFTSQDAIANGWDGKVNNDVTAGVYTYHLEVNGESIFGQFIVDEN